MTRDEAKMMACSRDCSCVAGKDRDNNYNECIDKVFEWHERVIKKLDTQNIRQALIAFEESKHNLLDDKCRHDYAVKVVDEYLGKK